VDVELCLVVDRFGQLLVSEEEPAGNESEVRSASGS